MKDKRVKIGIIIASILLIVIVSIGFTLKNNNERLSTKQEVGSSNIEKNDNSIQEKNSKDDIANSEKNSEDYTIESEKNSNKESDITDNNENVSEHDEDTSSGSYSAEDSLINSGENQEHKVESSNENSQKPQEESKPEVNEQSVTKYVTISITCNTILNNLDKVAENKKDIIPADGVILAEKSIELKEGDTVFDVLLRETRSQRVHMDFVESPVYGSAYIKGIANLYEFDAGDLSGWMYSVNGIFPNYGCSNYKLNDGDVIQWKYTCDLGRDL